MKSPYPIRHKRQGGFTIVELMIATLVFSLVLLLVTMGVLQVNRVYYKGVTEANTQNVARSITDTISQAIQFSGGNVTPLPTNAAPTPGTMYYVCVNNQQFIYWPGYQLVNGTPGLHQANHSLVQRTIAGSCGAPVAPISGRELISPNMRLSNLQISQVPGSANLFKIRVTVVYGDEDVLTGSTSLTPKCKSIAGNNHFCSVSDLTTVVEKRVN